MDLLSYLIEARTKQGLTIRDVALRIGEPYQFVGRVETAERRLNVYEYVQYCEALNLDPSEGLKLLFRDKT
jgi:transcriptional regulator with XRE-family HTH domain